MKTTLSLEEALSPSKSTVSLSEAVFGSDPAESPIHNYEPEIDNPYVQGERYGSYRYKGGNPYEEASWEYADFGTPPARESVFRPPPPDWHVRDPRRGLPEGIRLDPSQMLTDPETGLKRESGMEPGTEFTAAAGAAAVDAARKLEESKMAYWEQGTPTREWLDETMAGAWDVVRPGGNDKIDAAIRTLKPSAKALGRGLERGGEAVVGLFEDLMRGPIYNEETGKFETAFVPYNLVSRQYDTPSYWQGTESPHARELADLAAGPYRWAVAPYQTIRGLISAAPTMAAAHVAPFRLGPAVWGINSETGFDPVTAGTMAALPGASSTGGALAEYMASRMGIRSELAKALINRSVAATTAAGMITGDAMRHIMDLSPEERAKVAPELVGTAVAMFLMNFPGARKQFESQLTREESKRMDEFLEHHAQLASMAMGTPRFAQREFVGERFGADLMPGGVEMTREANFYAAAEQQAQIDRLKVEEAKAAEDAKDQAVKDRWENWDRHYWRMVAQLKATGNKNLTKAEIKAMFPDVFEGLERGNEKATIIAKGAFGPDWDPVDPKIRDERARIAAERRRQEELRKNMPQPITPVDETGNSNAQRQNESLEEWQARMGWDTQGHEVQYFGWTGEGAQSVRVRRNGADEWVAFDLKPGEDFKGWVDYAYKRLREHNLSTFRNLAQSLSNDLLLEKLAAETDADAKEILRQEAVHRGLVKPEATPPLEPTMDTARKIAEMSPDDFVTQAKSFNGLNLAIGRNATAADYAELKALRDRAVARYNAAKESGDMNAIAALSTLPQFFNEAIAEYRNKMAAQNFDRLNALIRERKFDKEELDRLVEMAPINPQEGIRVGFYRAARAALEQDPNNLVAAYIASREGVSPPDQMDGNVKRYERILKEFPPTPPSTFIIGSGKPNGAEVEIVYDAIEADELDRMTLTVVGEAQTRQREGNKASEEQIANIAANPDLRYLFDYPDSLKGSPVVDDKVLAGNGRAKGLIRMYQAGQDASNRYRAEALRRAKELGIEEKVAGMKQPVIVRRVRRYVKGTQRDFVVESNPRNAVLQETAVEAALGDYNALGDLDAYEFTDSGALSATSARTAAQKLREAQRPVEQTSGGDLNMDELNKRFQRAALAKLANDHNVPFQELASMMESDEGKRLVSLVVRRAPSLGKLDADLNLGGHLLSALRWMQAGIRSVKDGHFATIDEWYNNRALELQVGEKLTPEAQIVAEMLFQGAKKPTVFKDFIDEYVRLAQREQGFRREASGGSLFGEQRQPVVSEELLRRARGDEGTISPTPAPSTPPAGPPSGPGQGQPEQNPPVEGKPPAPPEQKPEPPPPPIKPSGHFGKEAGKSARERMKQRKPPGQPGVDEIKTVDDAIQYSDEQGLFDFDRPVAPTDDVAYIGAVKAGNTEAAQRMVNEAAIRSGLPILDDSASQAYRVRRTAAPKKTIKAYKLFRTVPSKPGKVFTMFVGADEPLPMGVWLDAIEGAEHPPSKTGKRQVKSKLGALAYRPGWHSGDLPIATHIGVKNAEGEVFARRDNEVWAEVEIPVDVDYQAEADANGLDPKTGRFNPALADIKYVPKNGMYRYKVNASMPAPWLLSGSLKINRILPEAEVNDILKKAGAPTMPWESGELNLRRLGLTTDKARNNYKLLDAVTYDDDGNIIPLSERFNPEKEDVRYSAEPNETGELFPGEKEDFNPLFDQATLRDLTIIGGELLESGKVAYPEWYKAMLQEVGPEWKHYFRRAYNQLRDVDALYEATRMMTPREEVELYNDAGKKIGKGSKHRPGLIVRDEQLMPKFEEFITPNTWIGPEGDSIDWTQAKAGNMTFSAWLHNAPAVMIADGPGVGKSGVGAAIAHMLTFHKPVKLEDAFREIWDKATPTARAKWLFGPERGGELRDYRPPKIPEEGKLPEEIQYSEEDFEPSYAQIDQAEKTSWDAIRPERKQKIYRKYGYTENQIKKDNVHADSKERFKVLIVGTSKEHIETSFKPDFEKFGIPLDHIEFITYNTLSNPGPEGSPQRQTYDRIMGTEWAGVIFDEAHLLKNAGTNREHNSRKLISPFRVYMTATPMDNVSNAIYFLAEITGKDRVQVMDQLGLKRIVKTVDGEDREFVVQKEGISAEDVKAALIRMRGQAIAAGRMIRREFPWWGDVIGRDRWVTLETDMREKFDRLEPEEKAKYLYASARGGAELPPVQKWPAPPEEMQFSEENPLLGQSFDPLKYEPTPQEIEAARKVTWESLRPEQQAKVIRNAYTMQQQKENRVLTKGAPGPYITPDLTDVEMAEQNKIYATYQKAIDKSRNPMVRKNLGGMRAQELKRWLETIKAKHTLAMIIKELEAGRNVVVFSNTVNKWLSKGVGESVWPEVKGQPNADWVEFPGALGYLAGELEKLRIPFAQIFGSNKDIKLSGIKQFYANKVRVALVTPESGGAGLNLDDVIGRYPRTMIANDISWKGDAFEQAMYRISRRNTASESKAHVLITRGGMADENIVRKMRQKLGVLRGIQAGEDTDLSQFLRDLNNPEELKDDVVSAPKEWAGELPVLQWEPVRGRTGKIRWRAKATEDFWKWWDLNGQERNPLRWRTKKEGYYGDIWVWADKKPEYRKPDDEAEFGPGDSPVQMSAEPGYHTDPKYSDTPLDEISDQIARREEEIAAGVNVGDNLRELDVLREARDQRKSLDERTDAIVQTNPDFLRYTQLMDEHPSDPKFPEWAAARNEIVRDAYEEVTQRPPEPIQQASAPINIVINTTVPGSMQIPRIPMHEVVRNLKEGLGIPFRYKSPRGGGFYHTLAKYIRVKRVADYGAHFHEAGHRLDDVFKFWQDPALEAELLHLGDNARFGSRSSWRPGMPKKYRLGEGVAEFMRYWVEDPAQATGLGPNMEKVWNAVIDANPDLAFMRQVREDTQTYKASDPQMQLRSRIVSGLEPMGTHRPIGTLVEEMLDDLHFLRMVSDDLWKAKGGHLNPTDDPHMQAQLLRGNFGRADAFVRLGTINGKTGEVERGKSLMDALQPVMGDMQNFTDYIVAVRAAELHSQGKESGFSPSQIMTTVRRFQNNAKFNQALQAIQEWNDALLQYAVDAGYLAPEEKTKMQKLHKFYIPMRRLYEVGINEEPVFSGGTGGQLGRIGRPTSLKRLTGSDRPLLNPIESLIENAYFITYAAEKNRMLRSLFDAVNYPGMGKWLVEQTAIPQEKVVFNINRVRDQLEKLGADTSMIKDEELLWFWREIRHEPFKDNVMRFRSGGKYQYYQLDPDLFRAIMASDKYSMGWIMRLAGGPAQLLRKGVTLDPMFALRNMLKDTVGYAVLSKYSHVPFDAAFLGMWTMLGPNALDSIGRALGKVGLKGAERKAFTWADALEQMEADWRAGGGVVHTEQIFYNRQKLNKWMAAQYRNHDSYAKRGLYMVAHPLQALGMLSQLSDEATRIGIYTRAVRKLEKQGMSKLDAHMAAAHESRDLMDFQMGGSKTKALKYLTAFWNAAIQGKYRFYRNMVNPRDRMAPVRTLLKGFGYVTAAKMIEQWMNWDDEDYWSQPRWQRLGFFHIPLAKDPKTGHRKFILVPIPHEVGAVFAMVPGMIMDWIKTKDVRAARLFPDMMGGQMLDNPVPQALMTALEVKSEMGYNYWQDRPLLPRGAEHLPYWARWTDTTSATARRLGKMLNVAPAKIEHVLSQTLGGLGKTAVHTGIDPLLEKTLGDKPSPIPVRPWRSFVSAPEGSRSQILDDFYTKLTILRHEAAARRDFDVWDNSIDLSLLDDMERQEKVISKLRHEMKGNPDQDVRETLMRAAQEAARPFVRNEKGEYRSFVNKSAP